MKHLSTRHGNKALRFEILLAAVLALTAMGPPIPVGMGVTCAPWSPDGIIRHDPPTPVSYLAADIDKPGLPTLTEAQRRQLKHFQNSRNRKSLRFVFLFKPGQPAGTRGRFAIFDATKGPCAPAAMYNVLNGASNEYYQPAENPWHLGAMPGG
jgi:hypothetical protein